MSEIKCGDMVITKLGKIEGMITCIADRFDQKIYEITTLIDSKHQSDWFRIQEFDLKTRETKKAGF